MKKELVGDYETELIRRLRSDRRGCYLYLMAALQEDDPQIFFMALEHVVKALKGVSLASLINERISSKRFPYSKVRQAAVNNLGQFLCSLDIGLDYVDVLKK